MNFGEYLAQKRIENKITLRDMAKRLDVSAPYLSDVEKSRRKPLSIDKIERVISILALKESEKKELLDLAGEDREEIAPDLPDYIRQNKIVTYALRVARDSGASEEDWQRFVENLQGRSGKD